MEEVKTGSITYLPINISFDAGETVKIEKSLPLLSERISGLVLLSPTGKQPQGVLKLSIAGEEIFPTGFHARLITHFQSSQKEESIVDKGLGHYIWPVNEKANGSTLSLSYQEPTSGESGTLVLILRLHIAELCQ